MKTNQSTKLIEEIDNFITSKFENLSEDQITELRVTLSQLSITNCPGGWFNLKKALDERASDFLLTLKPHTQTT